MKRCRPKIERKRTKRIPAAKEKEDNYGREYLISVWKRTMRAVRKRIKKILKSCGQNYDQK